MDEKTSNSSQNSTQKTKDGAIRTPLKISSEHRCSGSSCFTGDFRWVTYDKAKVILPHA
jgi:hypothetical protein